MVVICKGILPQIAHLVPFIMIPCWMKRQKWNVDSIYPNFKGKFQVDIMSFSSYLEMKYSIFFEWAIFKTFATVTFHYRIYAQLDGSFILHFQQIPTDLGRKAPTKSHPKGDTSNVCRLCEFFRVFRGVLGMKTSSLLCFLGGLWHCQIVALNLFAVNRIGCLWGGTPETALQPCVTLGKIIITHHYGHYV